MTEPSRPSMRPPSPSRAPARPPNPYRDSSFGAGLPLSRLVPPPRRARRVAVTLSVVWVLAIAVGMLAPWQQSVQGRGRVIAFAPLERQQLIEAPIDARVVRWYVQEGSRVDEGDVLVELADNDPLFVTRLADERALTEDRVRSYESRVTAFDARLASVEEAQRAAVAASDARVRVAHDRLDAADQSVLAYEADLETQTVNLTRHRAMVGEGLVSQRDLELAILAEARARTSRDSSLATRGAARSELRAAEASLAQARATMLAEVENARASLESSRTDLQNARAALIRLDSRVARQETQRIVAPRAGMIFRIQANQGGEQVKAGDPLMTLVPDATQRAVELWVDGNDAALVAEGRHVRLQFEGWPAVQFTGWPSVAVGTFGGHVAFVDSTDDGQGNFRIVILPDDGEPWPEARYMRQGVRANGWVLLRTVRLGFEIWRQINGFPPAVSRPPSTAPQRTSGYSGSSGSSYGGGSGYGGGSSYGGGSGYGGGGYDGDSE